MTTPLYVMEACAEHGKSLLVLDRPNPLGGKRVEGGFLKQDMNPWWADGRFRLAPG